LPRLCGADGAFRRRAARARPPRGVRAHGRGHRGRGAPAARLLRPAVRSGMPRRGWSRWHRHWGRRWRAGPAQRKGISGSIPIDDRGLAWGGFMHTNKLKRITGMSRTGLARLPLAAAICLAIAAPALAQDAGQTAGQAAATTATPATKPATKPKTTTLGVVTVTAQKRTENLQKVPISIGVLENDQLEALHVQNFNDYVKYLPSVTFQQGGGGIATGPGFATIYMRGVASGGNTNHSGSQPSVGVYLDDQPVTTIQGPLDIHMYDIARIEVLAGPQGTLYGASAESGALRIITNKPDPSGFAANYTLGVDQVNHGGIGSTFEGMLNLPLSKSAAVRFVGWHEHDAGYIDNKAGSRTFPSSGITVSNADNCTPVGS